ncbi:hypothetical protein D3C72_1442110 [compost metagenome]
MRGGLDRAPLADVLGHVVFAVVQAHPPDARLVGGGEAHRREVGHALEERGVLAAKRQLAEVGVLQADERLAIEQRHALQGAAIPLEATFEHEQRLGAGAEVFHTTQAPARGAQAADVGHAEAFAALGRGGSGCRHPVDVFDRAVDDPIQRHAGLCVGGAGRCAKHGQGDKRFPHAKSSPVGSVLSVSGCDARARTH